MPETPERQDAAELERLRKKQERQEEKDARLRERLREKVLQWCKDVWRPYHGSTRHRDDTDGNQMIEKKKAGGHSPLNAAVMALWGDTKLSSSRDLFSRELYRLAMGTPAEVVAYSEIQDLFRDYGAGDSDYDDLRAKAERFGQGSESAHKLGAVDLGIDLIVDRLFSSGVKNQDFWADFGLNAVPTTKALDREGRYRSYYLYFLTACEALARDHKRYRNRATQETADHFGVSKRTVEEAVSQVESGYVDLEAS